MKAYRPGGADVHVFVTMQLNVYFHALIVALGQSLPSVLTCHGRTGDFAYQMCPLDANLICTV